MGIRIRFKVGLSLVLVGLILALGSAAQAQVKAAPTGLTATAGNAQVALRWSAVTGAGYYRLKRSTTSGGPYVQISDTTWNGFTDDGVKNGVVYYYVVTAVDASGDSANSAQVSAKPGVSTPAPTGFSATAGNGEVGLRWSAVTGAGYYRLKRSTRSGGPYTQIGDPTWNGYTDQGVTNGVVYYYVVTTVEAQGESANSAQVSVTPGDSAPAPVTSGLPEDFFSISWSSLEASHYPTVPFKGMRAWDTGTSWAQIEWSQGNYNWTTLDNLLEWESSHGKDVMYTFGFVPHWASSTPGVACFYLETDTGCTGAPIDVESGDNMWKAFVTALVKHSLSSPKLHIAYYELWNEPDLKDNWTGTPAQLVTLAKDAYAIIHELDPNAKVVGPSPSTANQWGVHYLPDYYSAGGATAQDIVGLHAYLYDGSTFSTSPAGITTSITQLKLLMAKYGISNKPIWFTEGNWGSTNATRMTDAQKADYVAQEYMLMWSTGAVSRYYWYAWDGKAWGELWDPSAGIHPAGVAYNRIATWLIGSVRPSNPCSEGSDGTWTCSLRLSTGYPAEIIWNASLSKTISVSPSFATYETISNTVVSTIVGNKVTIGAAPIMVVGSQAVQ
jgi:fibronectin type 3 domain-containing protein